MGRPVRELQVAENKTLTHEQAFAIVLRARRMELGLTQSDLENDGTLDRSFISKFELAKREVGLKAIFHLASVLQMTPGQLMDRVEKVLVEGVSVAK